MSEPQAERVVEPPAMGERRARWGYGYQDKAATERILSLLGRDIREGGIGFQGVRLADLTAGRVDDFVLVSVSEVEGNSIKWSGSADPLTWGDLIGAEGFLRDLAEGHQRLRQRWTDRNVTVRFQTNRPASPDTHHAQLIPTISVAAFLANHWASGPTGDEPDELAEVWRQIAEHLNLRGVDLTAFAVSCQFALGTPEPPGPPQDSLDWKRYGDQFDSLHKDIATWFTNNPEGDFIDREFLLNAIGFRASRSGLIQRFPAPDIPYERNRTAADRLLEVINATAGGYIAVTGPAGIGKSTLVQDVLSNSSFPFLVPYYAFLPSTDGNRDRGEALTFFQDIVERLDRQNDGRRSLGISDVVQGRDALRRHMAKANERFVLHGQKAILLVDGLDHVAREVGLHAPVLHELPQPEEVPDGFVIILSGQPQAFLPGTIPLGVAAAVAHADKQVDVAGLSRHEVHELVGKIAKVTTGLERDALYESCQGNPLILTYLLTLLERSPETTVEAAISLAGKYEGTIDPYYRERLALSLLDGGTRRLLGYLCRAAPMIPVAWLQTWPQAQALEDLYLQVLAPFIRVDDGAIYFIHDSLIAFLKSETRSRFPGADVVAEEKAFYSDLADRSAGRLSSDPVGRARVFHLLRSERYVELLEQLSSAWLRDGMFAFLPYAHIRPMILSGFTAAHATQSWDQILRLILLDFELDQRTSRIEPTALTQALLDLDEPELALAQIRFGGRLLVDDGVAMRAAKSLWKYADRKARGDLKLAARALYLQSKPIALIYQSDPINNPQHPGPRELLSAWSDVAPLFEPLSTVVQETQRLKFAQQDGARDTGAPDIKAKLLFGAFGSALDAGYGQTECHEIVGAIEESHIPEWRFVVLLRLAEVKPAAVPIGDLRSAHSKPPKSADIELAYAWYLFRSGHIGDAVDIVRGLGHVRFEAYRDQHVWGFSDVTYTVQLRYLQEMLGLPEGPVPGVNGDSEEGFARVERTARELGYLLALSRGELKIPDRDATFRSILLFHNKQVQFAAVGQRHDHIVVTSRVEIYRQLAELARTLGADAVASLRDVFLELLSGPAGPQFTPLHRQFFALFFFKAGVIPRAQATTVGLSSTLDETDEDPTSRQEACLEMSSFLHQVGDAPGALQWRRRASEVSAGAGSHKDYHMAHVAKWLVRSVDRISKEELIVLERFARAVEVAGGHGGADGAGEELQLLMVVDPARAFRLGVEWIDRDVLNASDVLEALVIGAADAAASGAILIPVYGELCALLATAETSAAAVAASRSCAHDQKRNCAERIMSDVRTNALPSRRMEVARALQDALRADSISDVVLTRGLGPGSDDSSRSSTLYRLASGELESQLEVASRLSDWRRPDTWNPNPAENGQFDWWSTVKKTSLVNVAHLDALVQAFPPPDYREVDVLALRAACMLEGGDRTGARLLTEAATEQAKDGSWHRWWDGAQKRIAFAALKRIDRDEGVARGREQFFKDLSAGKLFSSRLLSEIGDTFDVLDIVWPAAAVRSAVNDYLELVLAANNTVSAYEAFDRPAATWSSEHALCRFVAFFLACPVFDVAVAARRALARYVAADGGGLVDAVSEEPWWDPVQLEHLLAAIHVGVRTGATDLARLRAWMESLNSSESIAVRGIAKRICDEQGWTWSDIWTRTVRPVIVLPGRLEPDPSERAILLADDVDRAWKLHETLIELLERRGLDPDELRSEFQQLYWSIERDYSWTDDHRLSRWMRRLHARFWLKPRAILGREAAMRLFGRRSLSGQIPPGAESAYDHLRPIYDPALELCRPIERPSELRAFDWRFTGKDQTTWLQGVDADQWSHYPDAIEQFCILGERTWLIRPEWEWPREERRRGVINPVTSQTLDRQAIEAGYELTYEMYLAGKGQDDHQLIVLNSERQLIGSAYRWAAFNSNVARALGWRPSDQTRFQWVDSSGAVTVRSMYWKDGWTWLEPPRFESLGEGWVVLATTQAIEAIRHSAPSAEVHLWAERHAHGDNPYSGKWHLCKAL